MSKVRPALAALLAATATVVLGSRLGEPPDAASVDALASWWAELGTPAASMAFAHLLSVALTAWLTVAATAEMLLRVHPSSAVVLVHRMSRSHVFHRILGGAVLIATATPSAAFAADVQSPTRPDDLVLVDHGPSAADEELVLVDVGPAEPRVPVAEPDVADATWTIERGDHLWRIAEETLRDRGLVTNDAQVAAYWTRVIEANRDVIGDDPDLVLPGQVVRLPK